MKKQILSLAFVAAMLMFAIPVNGWLIQVYQVPDPIQDNWLIPPEVHEIGTINFPPAQLFASGSMPWGGHIPCPSEYGGGGAVQVWIQNLTGCDWPYVWYVADPETSLSNWDEWVGQVGFAPPGVGIPN